MWVGYGQEKEAPAWVLWASPLIGDSTCPVVIFHSGKEKTEMKILIVVITASFLLASITQADSFRCGSRVVSTGDSKADVIIKCGPPDYSEVTSVEATGSSVIKIESFYYNCGEGRFTRVLIFRGSTLVGIRSSGNYGSGPQRCE